MFGNYWENRKKCSYEKLTNCDQIKTSEKRINIIKINKQK